MLIKYRQGIISAQESPPFLNYTGGSVHIEANDRTLTVAFAFGNDDYLFSEQESIEAWTGPFVVGTDYWLFWDINLTTGERTFGHTTQEPQVVQSLPTGNQPQGLHVFTLAENKMKVRQGNRWVDRLRVFSAKLSNGAILETLTGELIDGSLDMLEVLRSQVGLNQTRLAGHLLFDDSGDPVKRSDGRFLTTESTFITQNNPNNNISLEAIQYIASASEPIGRYNCVTWTRKPNRMGVASYQNLERPCIGIAIEGAAKDTTVKYITKGFIKDILNFDWDEPSNTPLFLGGDGTLTTIPSRRISLQRVGYIVNKYTIYVDIKQRVLIDRDTVGI